MSVWTKVVAMTKKWSDVEGGREESRREGRKEEGREDPIIVHLNEEGYKRSRLWKRIPISFLDTLSLRCPSDNYMKIGSRHCTMQTSLEIEMGESHLSAWKGHTNLQSNGLLRRECRQKKERVRELLLSSEALKYSVVKMKRNQQRQWKSVPVR
jgi:hypothetical protein